MTAPAHSAPARDPRLTAARPDLADARLRGAVQAARFVAGTTRRVGAPLAPLRRAPRDDAALDTEALRGEAVTVFEVAAGWAYAQLEADGYVGYLPAACLGDPDPAPTHRVTALRSFVFPAPDLKRPPLAHLSLSAAVAVEGEEGAYARLAGGGYVYAAHLADLSARAPDYAATATRLLGTPYLWGGRSSLGLDCSGLVQIALGAAGIAAPRDADLQEAALGIPVPVTPGLDGLARGDLVFWRGHVGLMLDPATLIHANGHHMAVAIEPLAQARARIAAAGAGPITSIRRLASAA
ncbi:NLP/P60 protein [Methylobacterium sp. 4-46]|uniref:C40 family peptidase n=1 Tax=unclassified Methylobacterium TaxID=2615210 RepID=UPI000165C8F2|nr:MULTISPECIES: NlpC/P60 family protein [Methylobacterium]ACA16616.1 NLP/P60 protein [Methylobacterium sp. 4-46]WFT82320.1 NlpC/P60 family protein [Methylobacterium nodulans]